MDVCATSDTAKCAKYFTPEQDGLIQSWMGKRCWMNPPYGRKTTGQWVEKAYNEGHKPETLVGCLLPASTDTRWFHDFCMNSISIGFIRGRIFFEGASNPAPFPSIFVVFCGYDTTPYMYSINLK